MITAPSEITTEKSKISNRPILMVEFPNIPYYIASKTYTLSGTNYVELLKRKTKFSIRDSIPQFVNGLGSKSNVTIQILDWKNTLLPNVFSGSPDKTNEDVVIRLKYDTTSTNIADSVELFRGKLSTYSINRDILSITVKPEVFLKEQIPKTKYKDTIMPIQYGDFTWNTEPLWWGDETPHYAYCPLAEYNEQTYDMRFNIAGHLMDTLPTGGQIGGNTASRINSYAFIKRGGIYAHVVFPAAGTFTNTSSGAYLEIKLQSGTPLASPEVYLHRWARTLVGSVTQNSIDGKSATYDQLSAFNTFEYSNFGFDELEDVEINPTVTDPIVAMIYFGNVDPSSDVTVTITDGVNTNSVNYTPPATNSWHTIAFPSGIKDVKEIENYTIKITDNNDGLSNIHGVVVRVRLTDMTDRDDVLYLRCKGRQYSGNWGGRKTSGTLITNPIDTVESILRDEYGFTDSDFNLNSFDEAYNALQTGGVSAAFTIYKQKEGEKILDDIAESMNFSLTYVNNKWRIHHIYYGKTEFTNSGTTTPGSNDIFTDNPTVSGGSYNELPIKKKGLRLSRTAPNDKYDILKIKFVEVDGDYIETVSIGSGNREKIIENPYLKDKTSAQNLLDLIQRLWRNQRFIANVTTFWDAVLLEPGDIINIRHAELDNGIVFGGDVTTQKWVIVEIKKIWRPHIVDIIAVEIP